ncbi:MAG: class I SAM-dependent methyltransferase [Rhodospirillales bacterium]
MAAEAPARASDPVAFIRAWTVVAPPPLAPELRLHLAGPVTPLWEATEKTLRREQLPPPYWAFAWPGGQALARYLLDRPEEVAGRRVLDFAAGSGIAGIAAARAGAAEVTASELDEFARAAIALNAGLNAVEVRPSPEEYCAGGGAFDVILAGDVCYERAMAERVWPWLKASAARGAHVLLADPGRAYLPKQGLREVARYAVPTTLELEDRAMRQTAVYRVMG